MVISDLLRQVPTTDAARVWRPDSPAPLLDGHRCGARGAQLRLPGLKPTNVCLHDRDGISEMIRAEGRWTDCAVLVQLWRQQRSVQAHNGTAGIFLELGANIGACTLEVLLLTNAVCIIFEPSPSNLFYLTRSLQLAAQQHPELHIERRVAVFPFAVGEASRSTNIFTATGNGGNAVVDVKVTDWGKHHQMFETHEIAVRTIDHLFPLGLDVHLLKMDIQGYECNAIGGMQRFFRRSRVQQLHTEVSAKHLRAHGCNETRLLELVGEHFTSFVHHNSTPREARVRHAYDITAFGPSHAPKGKAASSIAAQLGSLAYGGAINGT